MTADFEAEWQRHLRQAALQLGEPIDPPPNPATRVLPTRGSLEGRDLTLLDIAERLRLSREGAKTYVLAAAAAGAFPTPKVQLPGMWLWTQAQSAEVERACSGLEASMRLVAEGVQQLRR